MGNVALKVCMLRLRNVKLHERLCQKKREQHLPIHIFLSLLKHTIRVDRRGVPTGRRSISRGKKAWMEPKRLLRLKTDDIQDYWTSSLEFPCNFVTKIDLPSSTVQSRRTGCRCRRRFLFRCAPKNLAQKNNIRCRCDKYSLWILNLIQ